MRQKSLLTLLAACLLSATTQAEVRLPKLIGDGMVLQRDAQVKIWGWASPGEKISVEFNGRRHTAVTNREGAWEVLFKNLNAGGPHTMEIRGDNAISIEDVLVGDVWLCSGQSNMEYPLSRLAHHYGDEIAAADNPFIRQFLVPQHYSFKTPETDLESGEWKRATPENVLKFSAVAYFFAEETHKEQRVPIGLINASLGGSPAEAWLSEEALKSFPEHFAELQRFKSDELIAEIEQSDRKRIDNWYQQANQQDKGLRDSKTPWHSMRIPGYWADTPLGKTHGIVWFRKEIEVPQRLADRDATLVLGRIVDADTTIINGEEVGNTGYQYPRRRYRVPAGLLKAGANTIDIRVTNERGRGGFVPDKTYALFIGDERIELSGEWQYRLGTAMPPLEGQTFVRWKPGGLYQGMIHPLLNYRIKGTLWYQGESNAGRPGEYATLFPALIRDWRDNWKQGDFPFLFVQLANFMPAKEEPSESNWAMLRESQHKTLSLPNTAMAVTIDVGEWNDVHPVNKKAVGERLALAARRVAYGEEEIVFSGPSFESMKVENGRALLSFYNTGSGLVAEGNGKLKQFAIAGKDKQFVWAEAEIKGNQVVVWSGEVPEPVAVRYAWADNPEGANLFNREGLPTSPFRTDNW
ncbi:sialate O-acetylesterase [Microbulbifer sp.]|uniref:sialate O-acetylesterase n=1 Tax=Microbulbifer sp. TaxID=1908541 RepID=UPI003F346EF9